MDKPDLSIATMTWARNEKEDTLLREAMRCLAEVEMPVAITDGGSGRSFIDYLKSFPNFAVFASEAPGVFAQIKRSLQAAGERGARFILYTESDKELFFKRQLSDFISQAPSDDQVGVVLASRSADSFRTYPRSQQYTEGVINHLCAEITGQQGDFSYGPVIINRALVPYLELVKEDIGWGWRHFIFGLAHRLGYRLIHWEADLPCPQAQQGDNRQELIHRMRQLSQNVQGLVLSTSIPVTSREEIA